MRFSEANDPFCACAVERKRHVEKNNNQKILQYFLIYGQHAEDDVCNKLPTEETSNNQRTATDKRKMHSLYQAGFNK